MEVVPPVTTLVSYETSNEVNMEKVLQSVVVGASSTSYNNGNVFFEIFFDMNSDLLSFDARTVFEAEHAKYLDMMHINKGKNLRKAMKKYLEE